MQIRRMSREDLPVAAALEKKCFGTDAWSEQVFADALEDENALYLSGFMEEQLVACCGIWKSFEDGDITNVAVEENCRQMGFGRRMLQELMKEAARSGVENFTLEVRQSNLPAIRLYESLGFVTEGVRKNFYKNPNENALIMWKR